VVLTCGASCPDAILDAVLCRLLTLFPGSRPLDHVLEAFPAPVAAS
jgi:4-hydroxy-3-methylbut-2-enyl diphosphate reductase